MVLGAVVAIVFARGYQIDFTKKGLAATGILVATSDPDGAEVFINNKLTTATNSTLNLQPGIYNLKIVKDGYSPWEKSLTIKKEEVFKTNVFLFPKASDLRPLTTSGALNPSLSPNRTQIAYAVASASATANGVWILDMAGGPPWVNGDSRQIFRDTPYLNLSNSISFLWTNDGKQVIASLSGNLYYSLNPNIINENLIAAANITQTIKPFPKTLALLASSAANLKFSPDETKVLYTATSSATLSLVLNSYLPGTNPTPEIRKLEPGKTYVYDLKEDRNYLVENSVWLSTSRHLLGHTDKEITVSEYDGTNKVTIYSGPFINGFVFPWPNTSRIVILTSLNSTTPTPDLYSINLR